MNYLGFISANWKWAALGRPTSIRKNAPATKPKKAYRWEQAYEAQQQVYSSTARRVVVTGEQLRNENKALLDSLKVRPRSVEFVYRTKWRTTTDTFPVVIYRDWYDTIKQPCPSYSLTIDTLCMETTVDINPDSLNAKVTVKSYGQLTAVGVLEATGLNGLAANFGMQSRGRKEAYIRITSPCFADTSVYLNEMKSAQ